MSSDEKVVKEVEKGAPQFVLLWLFVQPNSEIEEIFFKLVLKLKN
jgi:hypothetical protein